MISSFWKACAFFFPIQLIENLISKGLESIDDPYFYLYYGDAPRYPSYFSLERLEPEVGRVLRFDSLSKILSAGIRIGFASGPEALLDAMDRHVCLFNTLPVHSRGFFFFFADG